MSETLAPKRLIAERRYAEAIVACRRLLLGQEDVEVRLLLGQALLAEERFDDVRVEMLATLRAHPRSAAAHRLLGEAFLRAGQKDRAVEELKKAAELEPDDAQTRELLEEAEGEAFPASATIERWFGDEEGRTVETEAPAFVEESTPVPRRFEAPKLPIEPSIQIDPSLTEEAARLERELAERGDVLETADSTLPGSPPARAGGLKELLAKAAPKPAPRPIVTAAAPRAPLAPTPTAARAPLAPTPAAPRAQAAPLGKSAGGTQVARPQAKPGSGEGVLPPPPARVSSVPPPAPAPPRAPPPPSMRPPSSPGAVASPPSARPPAPVPALRPPAPEPAEATAELALPELEDDEDELPAPESESDELELTRPLPPIQDAQAMPPSAGPPRGGPLVSRPPGVHGLPDPHALPSFGPAQPLPALGPAPEGKVPLAPVPLLPPTAPEIQLAGAAHPRTGLDAPPVKSAVPPTAVHAPPFAGAPPVAAAAPDRRRLYLAIGVGAALVLGLLLVWLSSGPSELDLALEACSADGRPTSFEAALALAPADGDEGERVRRALLLAISDLELGTDHTVEIDQLLAGLDPETGGGAEARITRSLALLHRGQGTQGLTVLSGLTAQGVILVEGFRARALVLAQVGTPGEAVDAARQAATLSPGTTRHAALLAELSILAGDLDGAQRVLDGVVGIDTVPGLRVVRAEVALARGLDLPGASADADAVLGPLVTSATAPELGRAHLVRAGVALARGDGAAARTELDLADTLVPRHDERRRLRLADAYYAAGAPDRALQIASALTGDTADPTGRAELIVRAALAARDLPAAERAVGAAGTGPRIDLLRAQIAEANGRLDEARTLYASAAADPTLVVPARTAEGRLFFAAGRAREAVVALTQALAASPAAPTAVLFFVRAALATGDVAGAERAAASAIATAPDEPEVLAAQALALRARARFDEAYAALARATAARPDDASLRMDLGDCALALGRLDDAARAYEAALASGAGEAAVRLVQIGIERGDLAAADAALARATGAPELAVIRARATLVAARGEGRSGTETVSGLRSGRASDPVIAIALATLYVQAEDDRRAREILRVALRSDRDHPEALLLSALIDVHEGRGSAAGSLEAAERSAGARGAPPSLRARISAVRARQAFDDGERAEARRLADQAIALDAHCAEAHLVIADLETEAERDPIPALRSAAAGTYPLGEIVGRLALRLGSGEEACTLGRRFLQIAPSGYDARDVRDLVDGCP